VKTRVGIIFGGRSSEHEVSIMSASAVITKIDRAKYEPVLFAIDKRGAWHHIESDMSCIAELSDPRIASLTDGARRVTLADFDAMTDFAFPLLHGPYGEDGTVQGLFEMLGKPYAGCGVAASALSMDKIFAKEIWARAGLPQCEYSYTSRYACAGGIAAEAARIENKLAYPIFVKPANMGSSVGVSKVFDRDALEAAIEMAFWYDNRVIAEQAISGREIEIGVIGNEEVRLSVIGEILLDTVYYDYDSKYRGGTKLAVPADIPDSVREEAEELAQKAYRALGGNGFARVDMFYDEGDGQVYLNEMNAIPGFTQYSMFPLAWQARGVGFTELVERIIELGYERHNAANNR